MVVEPLGWRARWFGGHVPKPPEAVAPPDDPVAAKERSDAAAKAAMAAKRRSGARATRLTDPILDPQHQLQDPNTSDSGRRVSLLGGGTYGT